MEGIINVLKPGGMTSHDVVSFIRKHTRTKRVGHTGTLDPGAAGVLPICVGRTTKVAEWLSGQDKKYRAELQLGVTTDTQDGFGTVLSERKVNVSRERIEQAIHSFKGTISQVPPMYSAVKVKGQKLYELARKGVEIERKPRQVTIFNIEVIDIDEINNRVLFDVHCSKGTYIRTLCHDIGEKLGCGAYMSFLLRLSSGRFKLEESVTLEDIEKHSLNNKLEELLVPVDQVFDTWPSITIQPDVEKKVLNGNVIPAHKLTGPGNPEEGLMYRVYNQQHKFIGFSQAVKAENGKLCLKMVKSFFEVE
ncbi:MAG: tRNA pseudouridine(55) synthase TruB [Clostridiaceae bacterium]|nr:tRNA pseudouridine(55) synthase TruB [Clostridiaceae bacterium]